MDQVSDLNIHSDELYTQQSDIKDFVHLESVLDTRQLFKIANQFNYRNIWGCEYDDEYLRAIYETRGVFNNLYIHLGAGTFNYGFGMEGVENVLTFEPFIQKYFDWIK